MNPKEKFDLIINEIERLVYGEKDEDGYITYYSKQEICERAFLAAKCYINTAREKNALFQFLLSKSVYEYIVERKMMAAYECLLEYGKGEGYQRAQEIVGSSNQSRFINSFKSLFLVTPEKAAERRDYTLLRPVPSWENVSGVDWFELEVTRLKEHYKLNDRECALAIDLHRKNKYKLSAVFEYVYNYVWGYIEGTEGFNGERDRDIEFYLGDENVLKMYFEYHFSMNMIFGVLVAKEIGMIKRELKECDKMYLEGCTYVVFDAVDDKWDEIYLYKGKLKSYENNTDFYSFYDENYQYYMENRGKGYTYYDYILYAFMGYRYGKEDAFNCLKPGITDYRTLFTELEKVRRNDAWFEREMEQIEEEMYQEAKRWEEEQGKRELYGELYGYELEANQLSSLEMDFYNPDFGEDGYVLDYGEDYDFEYEADLDEPEWQEDQYLSISEEDQYLSISEEDQVLDFFYLDDDHFDEPQEERKPSRTENSEDFEKLCEAYERNEIRIRLSKHSGFRVTDFLDEQVQKWEDEGGPFSDRYNRYCRRRGL